MCADMLGYDHMFASARIAPRTCVRGRISECAFVCDCLLALPLACVYNRRRRIPKANQAGNGAMSSRRRVGVPPDRMLFGTRVFGWRQLLVTDSKSSAWNYCGAQPCYIHECQDGLVVCVCVCVCVAAPGAAPKLVFSCCCVVGSYGLRRFTS